MCVCWLHGRQGWPWLAGLHSEPPLCKFPPLAVVGVGGGGGGRRGRVGFPKLRYIPV